MMEFAKIFLSNWQRIGRFLYSIINNLNVLEVRIRHLNNLENRIHRLEQQRQIHDIPMLQDYYPQPQPCYHNQQNHGEVQNLINHHGQYQYQEQESVRQHSDHAVIDF